MASQAAPAKRQQGGLSMEIIFDKLPLTSFLLPDLQLQYSTYKNTLQQIAQKIGDVEQEAEEHK